MTRALPLAYAGLGSNVDRERHLRLALDALRACVGPLRFSPVYESADSRFQGPPFYNLVVAFTTDLPPTALRNRFRDIEARCGRTTRRSDAFPLDIDLLLYGDLASEDPRLPHPDILSRAFVLKPLSDLVPDLRHPSTGRTLAWHWAAFDHLEARALKLVDIDLA